MEQIRAPLSRWRQAVLHLSATPSAGVAEINDASSAHA
jgi:hypothetical protein